MRLGDKSVCRPPSVSPTRATFRETEGTFTGLLTSDLHLRRPQRRRLGPKSEKHGTPAPFQPPMWSLLPSVWPELSCEIHSLHHQNNKFIFGYTNAEDRGLSSRSTEGKHKVYCTGNFNLSKSRFSKPFQSLIFISSASLISRPGTKKESELRWFYGKCYI